MGSYEPSLAKTHSNGGLVFWSLKGDLGGTSKLSQFPLQSTICATQIHLTCMNSSHQGTAPSGKIYRRELEWWSTHRSHHCSWSQCCKCYLSSLSCKIHSRYLLVSWSGLHTRRNDTNPIPEASEVLFTMTFSGPGKFSCPLIVKIMQGGTKRCPSGTLIAEKNDVRHTGKISSTSCCWSGSVNLVRLVTPF